MEAVVSSSPAESWPPPHPASASARALRTSVTRADVARYAGVSTAVVSYVVNGGPRPVSPATAKRVLDAIDVLGYRPNATARALRTGSTQMLGLVVPEIGNPYFAEMALAIEHAAAAKGFAVLLTNSESDAEVERRNIRNLIARQVDGLILASVQWQPDLKSMPLAGTPTVLLNMFAEVPGFASIGVDAYAGAYEGVQHLIAHGHRTVALVIGQHTGDTEHRELGWLQATRDAGLPDGPIARDDFSRRGGYRAGHRLFAASNPPTAVFCSSDLQSLGLLHALWELGLRVPEDVAIVSFDGTEDSAYTNPPLTAVRQPVAAMTQDAIARILGASDARVPPAGHVTHAPELLVRQSCGCPAGTPGGRG